ncbi:PREDICTED: uncharacterized protein LOC106820761 [Priapulus caudatus]|uniref:Protein aurora borealis n=1 Tax=Priapulus caudatus TaxID=37621 RepID=A0ABM1F8N4_PRICU|nr:PREDICTED: uncharacterized protein LOC106820761 [Priapulus caudatus]XP_014680805.1 PREDICTED: uncharacterized protein LOC106820761 [Priapulus caudatus]
MSQPYGELCSVMEPEPEEIRRAVQMNKSPMDHNAFVKSVCPSSDSPWHVFKTPNSTLVIHRSPRTNAGTSKTPSTFSLSKSPYESSTGGSVYHTGTPLKHLTYSSSSGSSTSKTPSGSRINPSSSGSSMLKTPSGPRINPFEIGLMDRLQAPSFSPSVFQNVPTPNKEERGFFWTIDELAVLQPVEMDERDHAQQQAQHHFLDHETESKFQSAIDEYFLRHAHTQLAASPSPNNQPVGPVAIERTAAIVTARNECVPNTSVKNQSPEDDCTGSATRKLQDASCQTTLTLPMNVNLEKLLAHYYTYQEEEPLNNSVLRRKLFFCEEANGISSDVAQVDDVASPGRGWHLVTGDQVEYDCDNSPEILSKFDVGPHHKVAPRASDTPPSQMNSPQMSPIGSLASGEKTPGATLSSAGSRMSQRLASVDDATVDCRSLSDIHSGQYGSFLSGSDGSSGDRVAHGNDSLVNHERASSKPETSFTERPTVTTARRNLTLSMICAMDADENSRGDDDAAAAGPLAASQPPTNLTSHDACMTGSHLMSTNQDTGYVTGSLQLTNHDSVYQSGFLSNTFGRNPSENLSELPVNKAKIANVAAVRAGDHANALKHQLLEDRSNSSEMEADSGRQSLTSEACKPLESLAMQKVAGKEPSTGSFFYWEPIVSSTPQKLRRCGTLADMDVSS